MSSRQIRLLSLGLHNSFLGRYLRTWALLSTICFGLSGFVIGPLAKSQDSALFTELTEIGLEFTSVDHVKLPHPTLGPELPSAAREEALHKLSGKQDWSRFVRESVMAPISIDIDAINSIQGERLGLSVHNAFIVHTNLDRLRDTGAMKEIFGRPDNSGNSDDSAGIVTQEITQDELRSLGFISQAESSATFAYLELPLLNQVIVRGVVRIERRERAGAVEFFWRLDPSFNSIEKYANRWTKLERNVVGKLLEGESFSYSGCGGFVGVYEISPESQQLLVESRLLLREPQEWFAGSNFLRSKLPPLMQENARNFRRKLASR